MCGRYSLFRISELINEYGLDFPDGMKPRYNIAPSQEVIGIVGDDGYQVHRLKWGLLPFWAKNASSALINARAETVDQKPSFKRSFAERRCLIPADGFYEWRKEGQHKQPYRIAISDRKVFSFAGLWETWTSPDGEVLSTCAILTTAPNSLIRPIHNRMPAVLPKSAESVWLDHATDHAELKVMLEPYASDMMEIYPVSTLVNSPKNDSPDVLEPLSST